MSASSERLNTDEDISMLKAELPNGGARVKDKPEQRKFDLNVDVPVLMEPVEMGTSKHEQSEPEPEPEPEHESEAVVPAPSPSVRRDTNRPEHFVVIYVTALHTPFEGQKLLESLVELDMQFGEMDIFHRLDADGESLFCLVNAVEPGTFDLSNMDVLRTPAVSLFMRVHELAEPVVVFDAMVDVAQALADALGGEVKDDSRSVMTPQTIEHSRDEIKDYTHRHH